MKTLMNITLNNLFVRLFVLFVILGNLSSCKNGAKRIVKEMTEESVETLAERTSRRVITESMEGMGQRLFASMDADAVMRLLLSENVFLESSLKTLGRDFKKVFAASIKQDGVLYEAFSSSRTLMDEFLLYVEDAPQVARDMDFLKSYAKSDYMSRMTRRINPYSAIVLREEKGITRLVDKETGEMLADYKDHIFKIYKKEALFGKEGLVQTPLVPDAIYKLEDGSGLLFSTDNLARVKNLQVTNGKYGDLQENLQSLINGADFGPQWRDQLRKLSQVGDKHVSAECSFMYDGVHNAPVYMHVDMGIEGIPKIKNSFENIDRAGNEVDRLGGIARRNQLSRGIDNTKNIKNLRAGRTIVQRYTGKEALDQIEKQHPEVRETIRRMMSSGGPFEHVSYHDSFVCEMLDDGRMLVYNTRSEATSTAILVKNNEAWALPGVTAECAATNKFLDYHMPNMKYNVGDSEYVTDELGRVGKVASIRNKKTDEIKPDLGKDQRDLLKNKDGKQSDDAGHLIAKEMGGINDGINIVPMDAEWQRHGAWRNNERLEKKLIDEALSEGKTVRQERLVKYQGDSSRPSSIVSILYIDDILVNSKEFVCP